MEGSKKDLKKNRTADITNITTHVWKPLCLSSLPGGEDGAKCKAFAVLGEEGKGWQCPLWRMGILPVLGIGTEDVFRAKLGHVPCASSPSAVLLACFASCLAGEVRGLSHF